MNLPWIESYQDLRPDEYRCEKCGCRTYYVFDRHDGLDFTKCRNCGWASCIQTTRAPDYNDRSFEPMYGECMPWPLEPSSGYGYGEKEL